MTAMSEMKTVGQTLESNLGDHSELKQRFTERASKIVEHGEEALENVGTRVRGQVVERPLTSIAVASGVGLLVGLLIGRKL